MRVRTSTSDPLDFCLRCAPSPTTAVKRYGHLGDGPDGRGNCFTYDDDHPTYGVGDDEYRCKRCDKRLTDRDDLLPPGDPRAVAAQTFDFDAALAEEPAATFTISYGGTPIGKFKVKKP
jgi:hypothetical protein